jgi:hypothetical protein
MQRLRVQWFKVLFGVLAISGASVNAWVLTVHLTTMAVAALRSGDTVVICRSGAIAGLNGEAEKPARKNGCPVCSGTAALHFGIIDEPKLLLAPVQISTAYVADVSPTLAVDHRLHEVLNRGPPGSA